MGELSELLSRVEQATGPDRELDGLLATQLLGWEYAQCSRPREGYVWRDETGCTTDLMPLTASIDDALALVERTLPKLDYELTINGSLGEPAHSVSWPAASIRFWPEVRAENEKRWHCQIAGGPTAPLAIIRALLQTHRVLKDPSHA